jgi:hypothetical protein
MRNNKGSSEHNEYGRYIDLGDTQERTRLERQQVEALMERGFLWEEALKLVQFHEHIYENVEMRQRLEADEYMQFVRWLYERGAINEGEET